MIKFREVSDWFNVTCRRRSCRCRSAWTFVKRIGSCADGSPRCCRVRFFSRCRRSCDFSFRAVNVSRIIARVGCLVEVKARWTSELMSNDPKTCGFQTPEVFLAVSWMSVESFVLALEVAARILRKNFYSKVESLAQFSLSTITYRCRWRRRRCEFASTLGLARFWSLRRRCHLRLFWLARSDSVSRGNPIAAYRKKFSFQYKLVYRMTQSLKLTQDCPDKPLWLPQLADTLFHYTIL